jgi:hypothetical protein
MYSKILILRFPKSEVHKPIVCHLTKDYDLVFNILNAAILPRKEGVMALELSGTKKNFKEGVKYLKAQVCTLRMPPRKLSGTARNVRIAGPVRLSAPLAPSPFSGLK